MRNTRDQVAIGLIFVCDWLIEWREFSKPITVRSETKPVRLLQNSVENSTKAETSCRQTISLWIATTTLQINKSIIAPQAFFKFCSSAGHRCHLRESSPVNERVDSILS